MTKPEPLADIQKKFGDIENVNVVHKKRLTDLEKIALVVTEKIGTMGFFFIILIWTVIWLSWNVAVPKKYQFDPFPAFVLWLFISNLIQIHLMPLIMIGQNIQGKHAQLRADHDFQTDKKAEKEIETILLHLEKQQNTMEEILKRIEKLESRR